MGGAASKASASTRRLPTSVPTAARQAPSWANTTPPAEPSAPPPPPPRSSPPPGFAHQPPSQSHGQLETGRGLSGDEPRGRPIGRSPAEFSGDKDDVVRRDALDPDFAANLSRLGPVSIKEAGHFIPAQSAAQRTLSARRDETADMTAVPPKGHLSPPLLSQLLDEIKGCTTATQRSEVYQRYSVSDKDMEILVQRVNSPSVGEVNTVQVDGHEDVEMKAVWVQRGQ